MAASRPADFEKLSAADKRLVNEVCERFELDLQAGHMAIVADHLVHVPEPLQPVLLVELLRLECEYRLPLTDTRPAVPTIGPYLVAEELGRGGFAIVYRATDIRDGRECALKVPHATTLADPQFRERFLRESEVVARLDHPHIVRAYEAGADGSVCYLATEYVRGSTLAAWLADHAARGEPVPIRTAAELVAAVADAVHHAHSRDVLHRDLKPSNILLQSEAEGTRLTPKVTDFGLARLTGSDPALTRSGVVAGTPAYMAPEQINGRAPVSARTDVYALGVILYELLTGRPPYHADASLELLVLVMHTEPPGLRAVRREIPADLEAVCLQCLEKEPSRRYATAGELADDLRRFLAGDRTRTRPPGTVRRTGRWLRRHPVAGVLLAAASLALAGAIGGLAEHNRQLGAANSDLKSALAERDTSNRHLNRIAYAAAIRKVDALLDRSDVSEARRLLAAWEPTEGKDDLRGWEWYYLLNRIDRYEVARWTAGTIYNLAFSPDGKVLAGAGQDHAVHLWDASTGRELVSPLRHEAEVNQVVWTPDGQKVISADDKGVVCVWSRSGGSPQRLAQHHDKVTYLAISPGGRTLASVGLDKRAYLWNLTSSPPTSQLFDSQPYRIQAVAFTPDGNSVIVGSDHGDPYVVEATANGRNPSYLRGHDTPLVAARSVPESQLVVTATRHETLVWDWDRVASTGRLRFKLPGREYRINDVAVSSSGRLLAIAGDSAVRVWDLDGPRLWLQLCGHEGRVWAVAFHPEGRTLATAGADGTVRLWDLTGQPQPLDVSDSGYRIDVLPRQPRIAVVRHKPEVMEVWGIGTKKPELLAVGPADSITRISSTPDGRSLFAQEAGGRLLRWDLSADDTNHTRPEQPTPHRLKPVEVFQPTGGDVIVPHWRRSLAVGPDQRWLATCVGRDIHVLNVSSGQIGVLTGHRRGAAILAAHPGGTILASAGADQICLWDVVSGSRLISIGGVRNTSQALAFSADGSMLASAGDDHVVRLWDLTGVERVQCLGHRGAIQTLAFAPDGRTVASGSVDGTVRLWQVATGSELLSLSDTGWPVFFVQFSSDGRYLIHAEGINRGVERHQIGWYDCGERLHGASNTR